MSQSQQHIEGVDPAPELVELQIEGTSRARIEAGLPRGSIVEVTMKVRTTSDLLVQDKPDGRPKRDESQKIIGVPMFKDRYWMTGFVLEPPEVKVVRRNGIK